MKNDPVPPPLSFACPKSWDAMRVDGAGRRFCDQCQLHVHDLSALSKREGARFLTQTSGRTCVSYLTRADGSMVLRSVWSRVFRPLTALATVVMPLLFASCASQHDYTGRTGGVMCDPKDAKDTPRDAPKHPDVNRLTGRTTTSDQTTPPEKRESH